MSKRTLRSHAIAAALACTLAGWAACGPAASGQEPRDRAARAGIQWMLDHAAEMPVGWAHPFLLRLHRIAPDAALAARLEAALRTNAASGRHVPIPADPSQLRGLRPPALTDVLFELQRRKHEDEPYAAAVKTLQQHIASDEAAFWRGIKPPQRAVYVYLFGEIGLQTNFGFAELMQSVREAVERRSAEQVADNAQLGYTLTHLVLIRSRYLRAYVDPGEFEFVLPQLRLALQQRVETADAADLDLLSEILMTFQLLRLPDDELTRAARDAVIARQNPDGSWGAGAGVTPARVHNTFTGIVATARYPDALRVDLAP